MKTTENIKKYRIMAGQILRQLRIESNIQQNELAKKMGCSRPNITQLETKGVDSLAVIVSICESLNVSFDVFLAHFAANLSDHSGKTYLDGKRALIEKEIEYICKREGLKAYISVKIFNG